MGKLIIKLGQREIITKPLAAMQVDLYSNLW